MHTIYLRFEAIIDRLQLREVDQYTFLLQKEYYRGASDTNIDLETEFQSIVKKSLGYKGGYQAKTIKATIDSILDTLPMFYPRIIYSNVDTAHVGRKNILKNDKDSLEFLEYISQKRFKHAASLVLRKNEEPLLKPENEHYSRVEVRQQLIREKFNNEKNAERIFELENNAANGITYKKFRRIVEKEVEESLPDLSPKGTQYLSRYLTDELYFRSKSVEYIDVDDSVSIFWDDEFARVIKDLKKIENDVEKLKVYWLSYIPVAY